MKMRLLILLFCLLYLPPAYAQYNTNQNKIWAFGRFTGLDFNSGTPAPITTSLFSIEGCASVCDKDGALLFYTEGRKVWDRTHSIMLGGDSVCPNNSISTTQGTVIVPIPDYPFGTNPTKYYIFSIYSIEYLGPADTAGMKMYYSMVDMSLNGGLGGIVPGTAGTYLISHMCEKVIAVPGANCDVWVLAHRIDQPLLYAFNVSACGLNTTPVVSAAGTMSGWFAYGFGAMKSSHDNRKIAIFNSNTSTTPATWYPIIYSQTGTELCDFAPTTGIVSNCFRVRSYSGDAYGDFSPDNTKLYVVGRDTGATGTKIWQYDITDTAAIHASEYEVAATDNFFGDIRLGPDGKMYLPSGILDNHINRIAAPNAAGVACNYQGHAIDPLPGTYLYVGMPNLYNAPLFTPSDTAYTTSDTTICFETIDSIVLSPPFGGCLRWYDGSTVATHTATYQGHYTVTSVAGCIAYKHTFNVIAAAEPCATGLSKISATSGITVFPIPASAQCTIQNDALFPAGSTMRLSDAAGREIRNISLSGYQSVISLVGLPAGIYQLRISMPEKTVVTRLIIAP